jgi:hypothetical protein
MGVSTLFCNKSYSIITLNRKVLFQPRFIRAAQKELLYPEAPFNL